MAAIFKSRLFKWPLQEKFTKLELKSQVRHCSGITGGGRGTECQSGPRIFHREIFADLPGKRGQGRKGTKRENAGREKEGKFEREEVEN